MFDFVLGYFAALFTVAAVWVANEHARGFREAVKAHNAAFRAAKYNQNDNQRSASVERPEREARDAAA